MTRSHGAVLGRFILLIAIGGDAHAIPILDQSFEQVTAATGGAQGMAQTFTVGVTGTLTRVEIFAQRLQGATFGILATTPTGEPTPFSVALATVPLADMPLNFGTMLGIDLTGFDLPVTAGDVLAWALIGLTQVQGSLGSVDPYGAGSAYLGRTVIVPPFPPLIVPPGEIWRVDRPGGLLADLAFRTYVEPVAVPEPGTLALLAAGLVWIGLRRRSR